MPLSLVPVTGGVCGLVEADVGGGGEAAQEAAHCARCLRAAPVIHGCVLRPRGSLKPQTGLGPVHTKAFSRPSWYPPTYSEVYKLGTEMNSYKHTP